MAVGWVGVGVAVTVAVGVAEPVGVGVGVSVAPKLPNSIAPERLSSCRHSDLLTGSESAASPATNSTAAAHQQRPARNRTA